MTKALQVLLYCMAAAFGILTAFAAFLSPGGAWPLAVISIALIAVVHVDKVQELSAGSSGVKAVLRDARSKLSEIQEVIEVMSEIQLSLLQREGRWASENDAHKDEFLAQITALMMQAGITEARIQEIRSRVWDPFVKYDYVIAITGGNYVPKNNAHEAEWRSLRDFDRIPEPERLRSFLEQIGDTNLDRRQLLDSYGHYLRTGKHLHPKLWNNRQRFNTLENQLP